MMPGAEHDDILQVEDAVAPLRARDDLVRLQLAEAARAGGARDRLAAVAVTPTRRGHRLRTPRAPRRVRAHLELLLGRLDVLDREHALALGKRLTRRAPPPPFPLLGRHLRRALACHQLDILGTAARAVTLAARHTGRAELGVTRPVRLAHPHDERL